MTFPDPRPIGSTSSSPVAYGNTIPEHLQEQLEEAEAADPATTTSAIAQSSLLGSANFDPNAMTPDALIVYLSTRLGNVDTQMNEIFAREKAAEKVGGELRAIQELLTTLDKRTDAKELVPIKDPDAFMKELDGHLNTIEAIDKNLADSIREKLHSEGQVLAPNEDGQDDTLYTTAQLDASKDYLGMVSKDIESGSQMDMIALQSLMGARQTAIQLATNLVSALTESQKSIVGNIR